MPRKQSTEREHHSYSFIYFVFHCETERTPGEPADNVDCSPFVFVFLKSGLISLVSVRSRVTVKSYNKCEVSRSARII